MRFKAKKILVLTISILLALSFMAGCTGESSSEGGSSTGTNKTDTTSPPESTVNTDKIKLHATIDKIDGDIIFINADYDQFTEAMIENNDEIEYKKKTFDELKKGDEIDIIASGKFGKSNPATVIAYEITFIK